MLYIASFLGNDLITEFSPQAIGFKSRTTGTALIYGSIKKWIHKHPLLAKKYLNQSYFDNWYDKGLQFSKDLNYKGITIFEHKTQPAPEDCAIPSPKYVSKEFRAFQEAIFARLKFNAPM
jgi:hypothetical protein